MISNKKIFWKSFFLALISSGVITGIWLFQDVLDYLGGWEPYFSPFFATQAILYGIILSFFVWIHARPRWWKILVLLILTSASLNTSFVISFFSSPRINNDVFSFFVSPDIIGGLMVWLGLLPLALSGTFFYKFKKFTLFFFGWCVLIRLGFVFELYGSESVSGIPNYPLAMFLWQLGTLGLIFFSLLKKKEEKLAGGR